MFFARRLCARTLTCYKLGLQELRNGVKRLNKRLPERLQLANPTGHLGCNTFLTLAVNEGGVDPTIAAIASKHKDPKSCMKYVHADEGTLMAAGRGVGMAVKSAMAVLQEPDDSDDEGGSDGSAPAMSQKHALPHHFQPAAKLAKAMNTAPIAQLPVLEDVDEEDENLAPSRVREAATHKDGNIRAAYVRPDLSAATAAATSVISSALGATGASYVFNFHF
jgi:hypothetical protein